MNEGFGKPFVVSPEHAGRSHTEAALEHATSDLAAIVTEFQNHYKKALEFLPASQAEKFKPVELLPGLFEQKIRQIMNDPHYAGKDFLSPEMQVFLKSSLTNNNAMTTGVILKSMEEVLNENAIAPTDGPSSLDVLSHQFFHKIFSVLIQKTVAMVLAEKAQK